MHQMRISGAIFGLLLLCSNEPSAQSVSIVMGGANAKDCYAAAQTAATLNLASREDVRICTTALTEEQLDRRDKAATYVNRGVVQMALENYQEAFEDYHRAMKLKPDLGATYLNRGNVFFLAEQYERAIEDYDKALGLGVPMHHVAHLNLGMAYEKLGEFDRAKAEYRHALEQRPEWDLPQQKLNRVLRKEGRG